MVPAPWGSQGQQRRPHPMKTWNVSHFMVTVSPAGETQ